MLCMEVVLTPCNAAGEQLTNYEPAECMVFGEGPEATVLDLKNNLDEVIIDTIKQYDCQSIGGHYIIEVTFTKDEEYIDGDEGTCHVNGDTVVYGW